jgi:outer membrane protein
LKIIHFFFKFLIILFFISIKNTPAAIGIINLRLLMEQAPQSIIAQQIIENDFKVRKQRLISLQKKIDARTSKFINEKELISKEKQNKSSIALQNMKDGMNALEREYQTDYLIRQKESADQFFKLVREKVKHLSKEKKYLIVIQNESVFWANNKLDITENILSLLNKTEIDKK